MVSAQLVETPQSPTTPSQPRPWPGSSFARLAFKALLAAPLVLVGVVAVARGHISPSHAALIAHTNEVTANGFSFNDLGNFYPPGPILVALMVGVSATGLAVVSSTLAGSALHAAWERMVQRDVPHATQLTMLCSATLIPSVWYMASQDLPTIGGLTMLVIAFAGFIRFVLSGDTVGGFTAGLFLAAAFLFDPAALAYAIVMVAVTPLLATMREFREPGAIRALVSVLAFPIVSVLLAWGFVEWRFDGSLFGFVTNDLGLFQFDVSALADLGDSMLSVFRDVAFVPVYLAVGFLLLKEQPFTGLGYLLPIGGLVLARWSGLFYSAPATLILLSFLAMFSVPQERNRLSRWLLPTAAVAQLVLNIVFPPHTPGFEAWFSTL
jgi:hypothetical protein